MKPATTLIHPKYRPDIDGLRAVAVLSVVCYHAFPKGLKGGFVGVDIFFVISGFLISTIIFENLDKGRFSFGEFYGRRIRRIFPALLAVLFSCLAFGWFALLADELSQLGKHAFAGASFISNFVFWGEVGYFDNTAETKPLLHLWSLSIEEQFYIFWPIVVYLFWKKKKLILSAIITTLALSFFVNISWVFSDPVATFYSPLSRFWEMLCGSLLAWHHLYGMTYFHSLGKPSFFDFDISQKSKKVITDLTSLVGLCLIAYSATTIEKTYSFPGYWALLPVFGSILIIHSGPSAFINKTILSNRFIIWFGLISFPLYLWHWPILSFGQIIYMGTPPKNFKVIAIILAIILSWLTVRLIESPIRFSTRNVRLKVATLTSLMLFVGSTALLIAKIDFTASNSIEKIAIARPAHAMGSSLAWYHGKKDWLFLGNAHNDSVAKLKLAIVPSENQLNSLHSVFSQISFAADQFGSKLALIVGPNKESIYPEFLPSSLTPSSKRYSDFIFDKLRPIPGLTLYDPTEDLIKTKKKEGLLYWRTDTHWNRKGAFLAFRGLLKILNIPTENIEFKNAAPHRGDLISISKLNDFPVYEGDNWDPVWPNTPSWAATPVTGNSNPSFQEEIVKNENAPSKITVWVTGDSFTNAMRPYFNSTFKEVYYIGHWSKILNSLPAMLHEADKKPDLIVVVRVERSF